MRSRPSTPLTALALALAGLSLTQPALAATGTVTGSVTRVLVTADTTYGGCMAKLSVNPATVLPLCGGGWVSFTCTGDYTDAVRGYRMFDQAQLALAADKQASVTFTDDKVHNGYCFATRIDVLK
jgi:hypothetical protein